MNRTLRKHLIVPILLVLFTTAVQAQTNNVGIGTRQPHPSAILDVNDSTYWKTTGQHLGVLFPRLPLTGVTDITTILNPAHSLIVYNTNDAIAGGSGRGFYFWDDKDHTWKPIAGSGGTSRIDTIYSKFAQFDTLYSKLSRIDTLYSKIAHFDTMFAKVSHIDTLYSQIAHFDSLYSKLSRIDTLYSKIGHFDTLFSKVIHADTLYSKIASFDSLYSKIASFDTLIAKYLEVDSIKSELARFDTLYAQFAHLDTLFSKIGHFDTLYSKVGRFDTLYSKEGYFDTLYSKVGTFDSIYARIANFDTLIAKYLQVDSIKSQLARFDTLYAKVAHIDTLYSKVGSFDSIFAKIGQFDTLMAKYLEIDSVKAKLGRFDTIYSKVGTFDSLSVTKLNVKAFYGNIIEVVDADYTLADTIYTVVMKQMTAPHTITLPNPAVQKGRIVNIVQLTNTPDVIADGLPGYVRFNQSVRYSDNVILNYIYSEIYASHQGIYKLTLQSTGSEWLVISSQY